MLNDIVTTEDSSSLLPETETILPCQFSEQMGSESSEQPEKRLMLAVLEDAIATFKRCSLADTRRKRRLLSEIEEWFSSTDVKWPFSFQNICAALGIDANYLLWGLARWRAHQVS